MCTGAMRRRAVGIQVAMGAVMVVVALAMIGEYDVRFESSVQADLPSFLVNPTEGLENTSSAQAALHPRHRQLPSVLHPPRSRSDRVRP